MDKIKTHTILCNYADSSIEGEKLSLNLWGPDKQNVTPKIEILKDFFSGKIPDRFIDFIEIATYLYCADQMVKRCEKIIDPHGLRWRRKFNFIIAIRDTTFWQQEEVITVLLKTMRFISDDQFSFNFVELTEQPPEQLYLDFIEGNTGTSKPEEVMLFSGGLDSLGGAIQEMIANGKNIVLVRHKSNNSYARRHLSLENALLDKCKKNPPTFINILVNKDKNLTKEYTQRSRSFLYFALGATVAYMLDLDRVRFYENGPVSINLPVCQQVIGGRATRTTHPRVLNGFQSLLTLLANKKMKVENPFILKTKTEVVKLIVDNGCQDLIKLSNSCAHSWQQSNETGHCGVCSQCIDRRFAMIAGNYEQYEEEKAYKIDILEESLSTGDFFDNEDKTMLTSYVERGLKIYEMNQSEFERLFTEVSRAVLYMGNNEVVSADNIFRLHKRHAQDVKNVVNKILTRYRDQILSGTLPADSLPRIIADNCSYAIEKGSKIPIDSAVVWVVAGESKPMKYGTRSTQFKILDVLCQQYKYKAGKTPHSVFQAMLGWSNDKYFGDGIGDPGLIVRRLSEIRKELGIEFEHNRKDGIEIIGLVKS